MQQFVDFLGRQSPYDALSGTDLERIAERVETEYFTAGTVIVDPDRGSDEYFRIIRKGVVRVLDRGKVIDELVSGDTLGNLSLASGRTSGLSVVAAEDTLCYRIPDPRGFLESPERLTFPHLGRLVDLSRATTGRRDFAPHTIAQFLRPVLRCAVDATVREAATAMSEAGLSYVLVDGPGGTGIVTDSDCRSKVATGRVPLDASVDMIATTPARAVDIGVSAAGAFLEMVQHGVHHLVVRDEAGTIMGVVRVVDLSSSDIRDPLLIRAAVDDADSIESLAVAVRLLGPTLAELYASDTPAIRIGGLHSAIIDAVLEKVVALHEVDAAVDTSWMVLGSLARREPLPLSDVDTGLVWQPTGREESVDPARVHHQAEMVIQDLERCGLRRCPDGANASNPLFNRSLEAWLSAARRWRDDPDGPGALLLSSVIADSRPVTGISVGRKLADDLSHEARSKRFLRQMMRTALFHRPPTGFVREFVVDASGQHRGQLDLKRGGLLPVVSVGRWIGLALGDASGSTLDRLSRGAAAGLLTSDETDVLRRAFEDMYELLYERELDEMQRGAPVSTYISPETLDSLTRRHLRETFRAISRVQGRLESEWVSRLT